METRRAPPRRCTREIRESTVKRRQPCTTRNALLPPRPPLYCLRAALTVLSEVRVKVIGGVRERFLRAPNSLLHNFDHVGANVRVRLVDVRNEGRERLANVFLRALEWSEVRSILDIHAGICNICQGG